MHIIDDISEVLQQTKETMQTILELLFEFPKDGGILTGLLELFNFVTIIFSEYLPIRCYDYFRHSYRMVISEEKAISNCPQTADGI